MDREFATKVSRKDGRKSYLAVASEVEVLAIIDTRGAREEPLSDTLWNVQPESLSPDWAVLGNVIRQGEEVRVRKKCSGFVLIGRRDRRNVLPLLVRVHHLDHTLSELQKIGE